MRSETSALVVKKVIILSLALALFLTGCGKGEKVKTLTAEEARVKAESFIGDELVAGVDVVLSEVVEENGLYKMKGVISGADGKQEIEPYITKDGKKFFTQAIDMEEIIQNNGEEQAQQQQAPATVVSKKQDKPKVELFVMSHCPYGTQIEKGILPAVEALGDKIDFDLKFCDYAMHGEIEVKEQLNQYCIKKEENEKFIEYLKCFLEEGETAPCLVKAKINQSKIDSCIAKTDSEFEVMENLNDKASWVNGRYPQFNIFKEDTDKYRVGGSPTLVINGETISSARDSKALLGVICSSFTSAPEECLTTLSSASPSPGFGYNTSNSTPSDPEAICN